MALTPCLTINITFNDISKAKEVILPILQQLKPTDFFYLFYDPRFKIGLVDVTKEKIEPILIDLKESSKIESFDFVQDESILDISKIMACAARKITEYLFSKINPLDIRALVEELAPLPEINADAYAPLHFVLNQSRLLQYESAIRSNLKINPKYQKGYKILPSTFFLVR